MASAALINFSEEHIIRLLSYSHIYSFPPCPEIIQYAYDTRTRLQAWIGGRDTNNKRGKPVERETRLAAFRLESVLESYVSSHFISESQILDVASAMKVREEIIFFAETAKKLVEQFGYLPQQPEEDDHVVVLSGTDHIEGKKSKMFGLDDELVQLKDWLLKDTPELQAIPIVGMAGIGKTSLAKEIYEDPDIVSHFECRAFVSVGRYYKEEKILQDIQAQMNHETDGMRCLIVLDDVWIDEIWFELPRFSGNKENGSRIILTTRLEEVSESGIRKRMRLGKFVLKKQFLNQQESWLLFCDKMFGGDHSSCPTELEEAARKIVNKYEGLPLTIITVANHLLQAEQTPEYWMQVQKKVHTDIISADKETSQVLYRSYKHLQLYLKPCFLYMGVFPHDANITASKLTKLWCAEGLLEPSIGKASLEEYDAMEYLQELVSANVVKVRQRNSSGGIKTCNIYPVFWHICMKEAKEHEFFHVIDSNNNQGIESQHRYCIHNNALFGIKDVRKSMTSFSHVRSILCTGPQHQYPVRISLCFSLLRVLDALTIRFYFFPSEVVKLVQLRYLAFTYNGKLPASISKLWNLQY
ncbi:putative disease resistance RPP8-like protein 2 [Sesamum alatum]|uniref:Disease resistance RPP8-like protein 2 n=1 Tax=Sesamum alatum TaxID=300844 RepID=A0AAE2CLY4_9LAMI|nr:putative disease resistance RPP8-like protein 2 [Sesamum alatum]